MPIALRNAAKVLLALIAVSAVALAAIWPWPAPAVDWRTPLAGALAQNDCRRAATILDAASAAGSIEAHQQRTALTQRNVCPEWSEGLDRSEALQFFRTQGANATIGQRYKLDEDNLGAWRASYLRAVYFLCVAPYHATYQVDNVRLSSALDDDSWIMALHRQRRSLCVATLKSVATDLVESNERVVQAVAAKLLSTDPLRESTHADFLFAKLVFEHEFVAANPTSPDLTPIFREIPWMRLKDAANARHAEAIRLLIRVLHQGRFGPHNDKDAYYWLLRARRLGHADSFFASEIEGALSDAVRKSIVTEESLDWRSQDGQP
jgi:hypothetical protein